MHTHAPGHDESVTACAESPAVQAYAVHVRRESIEQRWAAASNAEFLRKSTPVPFRDRERSLAGAFAPQQRDDSVAPDAVTGGPWLP